MSELSEAEQAHARGRVYGLFARLLIDGIDAATLAQLQALEWLLEADTGAHDLDELAAEHHACLQLDVFPYAGVFLSTEAVAGAWADRCRAQFESVGFRPRLDQLAADHLGVAVACLSFVSAAIGEALDDGQAHVAAELERRCAALLDACVLAYLPVLVAAIEHERATRLWPRVLGELLEFAALHRAALPSWPGTIVEPTTGPAADWLDDRDTNLRRIAEYLLCPAYSGVFLTRADVAALGRKRELPRGFGSRVLTLDNLLHSAIDYGQLAVLLDDLDALLLARAGTLERYAAQLNLARHVRAWLATLARTRALLATMIAAAIHSGACSCTSKPSTTPPPTP